MAKNATSIFTLAVIAVLLIAGISWATNDYGNSTSNKTIIIEKYIPMSGNDNKTQVVNNYYGNNDTPDVENNYNYNTNNNITTIINNGVPANVSVVAVANSYGNEGVSVKISDTSVIKAGTAAPVAKLQAVKTKLTGDSEIEEVEAENGLVISDMFLGDSKRPCEFINITNNNNYTAHLEGMRLEELNSGYVFTFSDVSIKAGKTLQVYSADKAAKTTKYYLGLPKSVTKNGGIWDDTGDTAFLICGYDGSVISKLSR